MSETTIVISDVLGRAPDEVEKLFAILHNSPIDGPAVLDLTLVKWIQPYGAVSLLGLCRYLKQLTHRPVRLTGLQSDVHAYLRRIDFFECDDETVYTTDSFNAADDLRRNPSSSTVLELFPIRLHKDVYDVVSRVRHILARWLVSTSQDIDNIVTLLSEACSNIVDHSDDAGIVTVQKYDRKHSIDINLVISDLGCGIRRSLIAVYGEVSDTCAGYIEQALAGLSARPGERGGQGLGAIQRIAIDSGGSLYIRSETGSVQAQVSGTVTNNDLCFFPGTQIAIKFRGKSIN
jgi:anti-sigma regulatory factor (Ser/Thr protein kinase)